MATALEQKVAGMPDGASIRLVLDGGEAMFPLDARWFSSGRIGYWAGGKLLGTDGRKYQVNFNATVIGEPSTQDVKDAKALTAQREAERAAAKAGAKA